MSVPGHPAPSVLSSNEFAYPHIAVATRAFSRFGSRQYAADTAALKRVIYGVSRPGRVLNVIAPGAAIPRAHPAFGKTSLGDRATAYVCQGMVCSLPIVDPDALAAALCGT